MTTKPTIPFVHGSWHTPSHFQPIINLFDSRGYPISCPLHPSIGHLPPLGLEEEAQSIRDELTRLVGEQGKEVVVVVLLYGCIVPTKALDEGFSGKSRFSKGLSGGVLHLIYIVRFPATGGNIVGYGIGLIAALGSCRFNLRRLRMLNIGINPSTYQFREDDRALPLGVLQMMVRQANQELMKTEESVIET